MTAAGETEWGELATAWREVDGDGATERWIRAHVARQTRRLRWVVVAEVLMTVVILGVVGMVVLAERTAAAVALSLAALAHSGLVWGFTIWNRSGVWRPLGESTRHYLALARERCLRQRRAARFVIGLVAVETLLVVGWLLLGGDRTAEGGARVQGWWVPPLAVIVGALSWALFADRRAAGALARVLEVERTLAFENGRSTG